MLAFAGSVISSIIGYAMMKASTKKLLTFLTIPFAPA